MLLAIRDRFSYAMERIFHRDALYSSVGEIVKDTSADHDVAEVMLRASNARTTFYEWIKATPDKDNPGQWDARAIVYSHTRGAVFNPFGRVEMKIGHYETKDDLMAGFAAFESVTFKTDGLVHSSSQPFRGRQATPTQPRWLLGKCMIYSGMAHYCR